MTPFTSVIIITSLALKSFAKRNADVSLPPRPSVMSSLFSESARNPDTTGIIPSFNVFTRLIPPGLGLNELLQVSGLIIMAVLFVIHSQLFFLQPYKSSRLAVLNSDGILLFSHSWKSGIMSENISSILKDSLKQEAVREIHLDQTILVIVRKKNISFILVTVKSSNFLRKALNKFSDDFSQKFESILPEPIVKDDDLAKASELIAEHFQFLPNYT